MMLQCPGLLASAKYIKQASVEHCAVHAQTRMKRWANISSGLQFVPNPAVLQIVLVRFRFETVAQLIVLKRVKYRLGRQNAGFHGVVRSFDLRQVQKARRTTDQATAGECQFWNRLITAFVQSTSAIGNPIAGFEIFSYRWVQLETLELFERVQIRICVVQTHHKTDRNQRCVAAQMIQKRATIRMLVQRPADRMFDFARFVQAGVDLPKLFQSDSIGLRLAVFSVFALNKKD